MKKSTLRTIIAVGLLIVYLFSMTAVAFARPKNDGHTHNMRAYAVTKFPYVGPVECIVYRCTECDYNYTVWLR